MRIGLAVLVFLTAGNTLWAQGVQTATLQGAVTDPEGAGLPGVAVTVSSPAMIGERTAYTVENGSYLLRGLPPGSYTVRFSLEGMQTVERQATLGLGVVQRVDATLSVATAEETLIVTGEAPAALDTTQVGANFKSEAIATLPVARSPANVAALAGGVNDSNTAVAGQVQIHGGMGYDNSLMVNGVNIQDPIFSNVAAANSLFIEDAISETQVLTSGISAEYGHFTGGVINVITKSGGNNFSGSFRADYSRPDWRDETPFEEARGQKREGDISKYYQATLGGPIVKDRLWFFLAGRDQEANNRLVLATTGIIVPQIESNERYEVKLTGNITPSHSLQASYIDNPTTRNFEIQVTPIELAAVARNSERLNEGTVVSYTGVLSNSLFAEARWSERIFGFRNTGGTLTDIRESPMRGVALLAGTTTGTFNAPYFDSSDPEDRNNEQIYGALSYFLSSDKLGSHDMKLGVESFTVTRTGGNSQSATGFVFLTDFKATGGRPVYDASGRLIPVFTSSPVGGTPFTRLQQWIPTKGSELDITTETVFFNDRWALNKHLSFNVGLRYEQVTSEATGNLIGVDTSVLVPRLGLMYDPRGDGKFKFDLTYGEYSGRYNPSIIGRNTPVGNPASITFQYVGPTGEGRDFGPAFNLNNYVVTGISVPGKNLFFEDGLSSPVNEELSLSAGMALPRGGFLKLTYVDRTLTGVIDDFITIDLGSTSVSLAGRTVVADNVLYKNTDAPTREYEAVQLQGRYALNNNWSVEGSYTNQFKNDGNYEGEGGQSIGATIFGDRPELQSPRNNPNGKFDDYQEHKLRLWTSYNLNLGRAGSLGAALVYRYDSPLSFSYSTTAAVSSIQRARDPGYKQPPTTQTLFFGERGAGRYNSTSLFDFALTYRIPVWKSLEPWIKFEIFNLLNEDTLRTFDTQVLADATSPLDANGLRTGFTKGTNFGKATAAANHVIPREYFIAAGIRF